MPRKRKAKSRLKNSVKKATVDRRVHISRRKVKINQPYAKRLETNDWQDFQRKTTLTNR